MVTKLARNIVTYSGWAVVRETAALAMAGGVRPEKLMEVLEAASNEATSPTAQLKKQVTGQKFSSEQSHFVNVLAQKDLSAAQEFAAETCIQTPIIDVVRPRVLESLEGKFSDDLPHDKRQRALSIIDRVYGTAISHRLVSMDTPAINDMIDHLFGEI